MTLHEWIYDHFTHLIPGTIYIVNVSWLGDANTVINYEVRQILGNWRAIDLAERTGFGGYIDHDLNSVDITCYDYISMHKLLLVVEDDRI